MPRTPELLALSRSAAEIKWPLGDPVARIIPLVMPCFKRSWMVFLKVGGNSWCVGEVEFYRLSAAERFSDAVQHHFAPWIAPQQPAFHYRQYDAEACAKIAEPLLLRLESYLNAEHKAGRPGLCERILLTAFPSEPHTIPAPAPRYKRGTFEKVLREATNKELASVSERVNALTTAFESFRQSNAIRATKLADQINLVVAQQSEMQATQRAVKAYLAHASAQRADLDTDRILLALAQAPCNGRGHVDRRTVAQSLGASPEKLDRLFPTPTPPPALPPAWLPGVTTALLEAAKSLYTPQELSRVRDLAQEALWRLESEFPPFLPQRD